MGGWPKKGTHAEAFIVLIWTLSRLTSTPVSGLGQTGQTACYRIPPGAVHHALAERKKSKENQAGCDLKFHLCVCCCSSEGGRIIFRLTTAAALSTFDRLPNPSNSDQTHTNTAPVQTTQQAG